MHSIDIAIIATTVLGAFASGMSIRASSVTDRPVPVQTVVRNAPAPGQFAMLDGRAAEWGK